MDVPKPLRARKVQLTFVGKEHTIVVRGSGKHRQVYAEDNVIVQHVVDVWTSTQDGYLGPCNEMFPFEFQLPANALPSFIAKLSQSNKIMYEIKAKIDRPRALDPNVNGIIHVVYPPIDNYPAKAVVETLSARMEKMHLEVSVEKNVFIPGETVTGKVKFTKDPLIKVRAVECALLFVERMTAQGHTDSYPYSVSGLRWEIDPSGEYYEWPFSFPTHPSSDYSIHGKIMQRLWMVDVKVDLPLKRDEHMEVPLIFLPLRKPAIL